MKIEELHQNLLNTIKDAIPQDKNMAYTLADILCLGREAVYRRLRGEVPFSFYEIATIAEKLNISVDDIMGTCLPNFAVFHMNKNDYLHPPKEYHDQLKNNLENYRKTISSPFAELGYSGNTIPYYFILKYPFLIRFKIFKWMYQHRKIESLKPFSKLKIPEEFLSFCQEYAQIQSEIKTSNYTWDSQIFSYLINDIKYFRNINFLTKEEVEGLKQELLSLLKELATIATRGKFENGNKIQLYISNLNFDTNYTYVTSPTHSFSVVHTFILNYLTSTDKDVLENVQNLIKAQQRFSTLISETGEIQRVHFFKEQTKMVEAL